MNPPWTIRRMLAWMGDDLASRHISTARLDAELLLAQALGCDRVGLYIDMERPLEEDELGRIRKLVTRRRRREPMAYILGEREFYGRAFEVTPAVLIPRPDSETLIEIALQILPIDAAGEVLDLGTGSGVLAITLAAERPVLRVDATDVCLEALDVARRNAQRHGVAERVRFHQGDLFDALSARADLLHPVLQERETYCLIVSNPPYVTDAEWPELAPEITRYEPEIALRAGADGLAFLRRICQMAGKWLSYGGTLLLEVGQGQSHSVVEMLEIFHFTEIGVHNDLSEVPRVVKATAYGPSRAVGI